MKLNFAVLHSNLSDLDQSDWPNVNINSLCIIEKWTSDCMLDCLTYNRPTYCLLDWPIYPLYFSGQLFCVLYDVEIKRKRTGIFLQCSDSGLSRNRKLETLSWNKLPMLSCDTLSQQGYISNDIDDVNFCNFQIDYY
jgi:hypothetical protein